jgi:hypothetical protein
MKVPTLRKTGFAVLLTAGLAVSAFAAEQTVATDIGTLDQPTAEKAFPAKPPYSPYRVERTACEAFETTGFPGGDGPLRRHGIFPPAHERRSRADGNATRPQMVR